MLNENFIVTTLTARLIYLKILFSEPSSPMYDIHKTYEECKFGRFHLRLLLTSFVAQIASLLVSLSTSYLLAIAECDLDMNLKEKGLLTSMPFAGKCT